MVSGCLLELSIEWILFEVHSAYRAQVTVPNVLDGQEFTVPNVLDGQELKTYTSHMNCTVHK